MTYDELLDYLRKLELHLRSSGVQYFFEEQSEDAKKRFVSLREEVSLDVEKLTTAKLEDIADELEELSADLNSSINDLKSDLDALQEASAILDALSSVLSIVGRILAFA